MIVHDVVTKRVRGLAGDFRDVIAGKYREGPMHEVEQLPLRGPVAGSSYLKAAQMPWQPTENKKFWIKPLYEDADKGEKTLLMKVDPGAFAPRHAHDEFEQFFVLEGSLFDEEQMMRAGDYICRAPGAIHTAGSDEGAIVLLIYTKAAPTGGGAT